MDAFKETRKGKERQRWGERRLQDSWQENSADCMVKEQTVAPSIQEFKIELAIKYLYKFSVDFPTHCFCRVDSRGG